MKYIQDINLALREFSLGNKEFAYKKLKKIFNKNQEDDQLRFNLAVIAQSTNRNLEAKENYKFLINKNNNQKAMKNLYALYIEESNYNDALKITDKLYEIVKSFDGSFSAEHGIGQLRKKSLMLHKDPVAYSLMKTIKKQFDPNNIMNPEKIFV